MLSKGRKNGQVLSQYRVQSQESLLMDINVGHIRYGMQQLLDTHVRPASPHRDQRQHLARGFVSWRIQ
jgi:hypothetical protein